MKILTANRLSDGEVVWFANGQWVESISQAEIAEDKAAEAALEAAGARGLADNLVVDVDLIDVEIVDGATHPLRLRERIRAAGPTNRNDLGKQARTQHAA
ncbi:DUF2849 domain-containing protein [Aquamicrobium defluvii]|uniref:Nitrite reductase n=1 Tax=Aquamicrobium defluvii TaxID=69279 RepID=A0A011TDD1_9HYPH|nr:DUF2849 domain-containing protein [Aquamicrobium defluvii]EXL09669.1 nitrite reductase [Aquamicrobium defluvii]EZQ16297.1 nitrite reductase [Halopseudomonas bauzanensis]TDR36843.1 uncharacterized protein DUF2849 [Aquamicrobium defluvii]